MDWGELIIFPDCLRDSLLPAWPLKLVGWAVSGGLAGRKHSRGGTRRRSNARLIAYP